MKNRHLFDNLEVALGKKQTIANDRGNTVGKYYDTVSVPYEVEREYWSGCSFTSHTKTLYRDEQRFNPERFNKALEDVDAEIGQYQSAISGEIATLQALVSAGGRLSAEEINDLRILQQKSSEYHTKYGLSFREDSYVTAQITATKERVEDLSTQVIETHAKTQELQRQTQATHVSKKAAEDSWHAEERSNYGLLSSLDNVKRASILADVFDQGNATFIIDSIKKLGFDATCLGFIASQKGHLGIMNLAIEKGANVTSAVLEGKTILQHAVSLNHMSIVEVILQKGQDGLMCSMINALEQNDAKTVSCILAKYSHLAEENIYGYTFFQSAVASNKFEVVKAVMVANKNCAGLLSDSGESAFKIALRSASPDIRKLIGVQVDASNELTKLIQQKEFVLLDKALMTCHFDQQLKPGQLHEI